jgi:hypothetical protein
MNTIPEGKEQIYVEAVYKEPIEGIPFSNLGLTVGISKYINEGEVAEELDKTIQRLVKEYFDRLATEIKDTRNDLIDKVRVEIAGEYDAKLDLAKDMIKELREENKKLKAN